MGATRDKLKGRGKQLEGKLTGDKVRVAEGTLQRKKGEIEGAASRGVRRATAAVKRAVRSTRSR